MLWLVTLARQGQSSAWPRRAIIMAIPPRPCDLRISGENDDTPRALYILYAAAGAARRNERACVMSTSRYRSRCEGCRWHWPTAGIGSQSAKKAMSLMAGPQCLGSAQEDRQANWSGLRSLQRCGRPWSTQGRNPSQINSHPLAHPRKFNQAYGKAIPSLGGILMYGPAGVWQNSLARGPHAGEVKAHLPLPGISTMCWRCGLAAASAICTRLFTSKPPQQNPAVLSLTRSMPSGAQQDRFQKPLQADRSSTISLGTRLAWHEQRWRSISPPLIPLAPGYRFRRSSRFDLHPLRAAA